MDWLSKTLGSLFAFCLVWFDSLALDHLPCFCPGHKDYSPCTQSKILRYLWPRPLPSATPTLHPVLPCSEHVFMHMCSRTHTHTQTHTHTYWKQETNRVSKDNKHWPLVVKRFLYHPVISSPNFWTGSETKRWVDSNSHLCLLIQSHFSHGNKKLMDKKSAPTYYSWCLTHKTWGHHVSPSQDFHKTCRCCPQCTSSCSHQTRQTQPAAQCLLPSGG